MPQSVFNEPPKVTVWKVQHAPSANTKATITQAAPGVGFQNIVTGFVMMFAAGGTAPTAITLSAAVIDGASGATTYLDGPHAFSIPNVAGALNGIARNSLRKYASENTQTTIEFSVAGGANTIQSVSMEGVIEPLNPA